MWQGFRARAIVRGFGLVVAASTLVAPAISSAARARDVKAQAVWTAPSNAVVGQPTAFDGCSSKGNAPLTYEWSWGPYSDEVWASSCTASFTFMSAGEKVVSLRVTDADGDTSKVVKYFQVSNDATAPQTTIDSGPSGTVSSGSASFGFSSSQSGSTFRCRLDDGTWSSCVSPKAYSGLANGSHTFDVAATDGAGNADATPASRTWTVNVAADTPAQAVWSAPSNAVVGQPATFDGCASKGDAPLSYEWSWGYYDTEIWATTCKATFTFQIAGEKVVSLRVTDADGQSDYLERTFNVASAQSSTPTPTPTPTTTPTPTATPPNDTTPPNTTLSSGPSGTVSSGSASFSFSASESGSTFRCRLDGSAWSSCVSPKSYTGLANGSHTFDVAATDAAGNTDATPASRTWTVNTSTGTGSNCMADPSVCGFPDVESTGVTPGTQLTTVNGDVTLSTPGQVYENKVVNGEIIVTAQDVTIRNVRINNNQEWYAISVKSGNSWDRSDARLTVDHVEINMGGYLNMKAIAFNGYTLKNSFLHNGSDCAHFGVNVVLEDNLCAVGPDTDNDGWADATFKCQDGPHYDGFQSDGGNNITINHNTIRNPCGQTSAILMSTNTSRISNVTITNNLLAGGGYTLYCSGSPTYPAVAGTEVVTGNRFAKTFFAKGGYWGATTGCETATTFSGNVWDDTGGPLN